MGIRAAPAWGAPGDWTTYTRMTDVEDVRVVGSQVWAATAGGLLRYSPADSTYAWFTNADGLAGNRVLCLEEDAHGDLWLGTHSQGLTKFEVQTGRCLPPFLEFRGYRLYDLCLHQGKLYAATDRGLSVFLPDKQPEPEIKETYHDFGRLTKDTPVLSVAVLDDTLWVGTQDGFASAWLGSSNLMDPQTWTSVAFPSEIRAIVRAGSVLYAATQYGVYRRAAPRQWQSCGLETTRVRDLAYFDGSLYAATDNGVYRFLGGGQWAKLTSVPATSLDGTPAMGLWAGTVQGLGVVRHGGLSLVPSPTQPGTQAFTDIAVDERTGGIWVATARVGDYNILGALAFDGSQWTSVREVLRTQVPTSAATVVVAAHVDRQGLVWLGTWGGGLHVLDQTTWLATLDQTNSLLRDSAPEMGRPYVVANAVAPDPQGNLWISNYRRGIAVMDGYPATQEAFFAFEDFNPSGVEFTAVALAVDSSGVKWIGMYDTGFFLFYDGGTPYLPADDRVLPFSVVRNEQLTSDKIEALAVDRDGVLWVGTDSGLNAVDGTFDPVSGTFQLSQWDTYTTQEGLPSNAVHAVCVDGHNSKWIGTERGLARINAAGVVDQVFTTANSKLVDDAVLSLAVNNRTGELWIGTAWGLSRYETFVGDGSSSANPVTVYPHPFILDGSQLAFKGIPDGSSVKIFTLAGELVRGFSADELAAEGPVWAGTNESGYYVGSGIYFYLVTTPQGRRLRGKIAVLSAIAP